MTEDTFPGIQMKEVFDWEAFGGCLTALVALILLPIAAFVVYFLFHTLLFFLPAVVAVLIILATPFALWKLFRAAFFKKVE